MESLHSFIAGVLFGYAVIQLIFTPTTDDCFWFCVTITIFSILNIGTWLAYAYKKGE